jgi:DNA primase
LAKLSEQQRKFLEDASQRYHSSLSGSPAEEHLATRGLTSPSIADKVAEFRLGFVDDPLPGHELVRGTMSIPYLRWNQTSGTFVVDIRFRCIVEGCDHTGHYSGKYASLPGAKPRMFNARALLLDTDDIAICEGEFDAITADVCGVPAVGVPGVKLWQPHWKLPFLGYNRVLVLADNDDNGQGMEFAEKVATELPNAVILPSPRGEDVNSSVMKYGKKSLLERVKA